MTATPQAPYALARSLLEIAGAIGKVGLGLKRISRRLADTWEREYPFSARQEREAARVALGTLRQTSLDIDKLAAELARRAGTP